MSEFENKEEFDNFIERLTFHNRGKGVDDHCTANPMFIVQERVDITGLDMAYTDDHRWYECDGNQLYNDYEMLAVIADHNADHEDDKKYQIKDVDLSDDEIKCNGEVLYIKTGWSERWEYVNAHLTREAAEAFIKRKQHNHKTLRIYVDSQYWCWEFNKVIGELLSGRLAWNTLHDTRSECDSLQAKIDSLMLEYCPNEMTKEQMDNWEKHQVNMGDGFIGDIRQITFTPPIDAKDEKKIDNSNWVGKTVRQYKTPARLNYDDALVVEDAGNGGLTVEINGVRYGWSKRFCELVNTWEQL